MLKRLGVVVAIIGFAMSVSPASAITVPATSNSAPTILDQLQSALAPTTFPAFGQQIAHALGLDAPLTYVAPAIPEASPPTPHQHTRRPLATRPKPGHAAATSTLVAAASTPLPDAGLAVSQFARSAQEVAASAIAGFVSALSADLAYLNFPAHLSRASASAMPHLSPPPVIAAHTQRSASLAAAAASAAASESTQQPTPHVITYTVQAGDTLSGIAQTFGVPLGTILAGNDLSQRAILHPGDKLAIPNPQATPATNTSQTNTTPSINVFDLQSALAQLTTGVRNLSALLTEQPPSATIESQIAALQSAISSQSYNAAASPALGGGASNTIGAAGAIDQLSGTAITNPSITGGSIANTSISGGTISGTTLSGTSLSAGASTLSTTTITGGLALTGGATFDNASSTNFFSTNASTTNATSTNLFATLGTFTTGIFNSLTASIANITGLTVTNSTTTNATTTNLAVTGTGYFTGSVGIGTTTPSTITGTTSILNVAGASSLQGNTTITGSFDAEQAKPLYATNIPKVLAQKLALAATRPVIVKLIGTSIAQGNNSPGSVLAEALEQEYGASMSYWAPAANVQYPVNGWLSQYYSGTYSDRLRGNSGQGATPITLTTTGNSFSVVYSQEADGGTIGVTIDGVATTSISSYSGTGATYANVATYYLVPNVTDTIVLTPPSSGYGYLEGYVFGPTSPNLPDGTSMDRGIRFDNTAYGGSSLWNMFPDYPARTPMAGMAPSAVANGLNGMESAWCPTNPVLAPDIIIYSGPTNDGGPNVGGPAYFQQNLESVMTNCAARSNAAIIYLIEPANGDSYAANAGGTAGGLSDDTSVWSQKRDAMYSVQACTPTRSWLRTGITR
jgi:LysM repeat protein